MGSRAELERLLVDDPNDANGSADFFPRSKTVRFLTSNRGVMLLAIAAGGLLILRPNLAKRVFRVAPVSGLLRTLALRFFHST